LLSRAVESVLKQTTDVPWHVIVVDDGSPVDAEKELKPLRPALAGRLTLVRQSNQGAAAARNRGLDCLSPARGIVAFLDSDDTWEEGHLDRAVASVKAGADFYFENYHRIDSPRPRFSEPDVALETCPVFDQARELHWFDGDFFDLLFKRSPASTPTIAYKLALLPHIRFRPELWFCEDIYFWMEAARSVRKVAFSTKVGVFVGRGVNISMESWGTFREARRILGQTRYQALVENQFPLTESQKQSSRRNLRGLDVDFWRSVLAAARRGEYRCAMLVFSYLALRPGAVRQIPAAFAKAVQGKFPHKAARSRP
jgi:succinoglycan biosynthesis protein ExoW